MFVCWWEHHALPVKMFWAPRKGFFPAQQSKLCGQGELFRQLSWLLSGQATASTSSFCAAINLRGRRQLPAFCFKRTMFVWVEPPPPPLPQTNTYITCIWKNADQEMQVLSTWYGTRGGVQLSEVFQERCDVPAWLYRRAFRVLLYERGWSRTSDIRSAHHWQR